MRWVKAVAVLVAISGMAFAAPPELKLKAGSESPKVGEQFVVSSETTAKTIRYKVFGQAFVYQDTSGRVLVITPKGGDLTVTAVAVSESGEASDFVDLPITVGGVVPKPGPGPGPQPDPAPQPDSVLGAKLKDALSKDIAAGNGSKQHALALADVYETSAGLLSLDDPAVAPKTVGDVYSKTFAASVAKGVPRRPYLGGVRDAIDDHIGRLDGEAQLTQAMKSTLAGKYRDLAAALKEASK